MTGKVNSQDSQRRNTQLKETFRESMAQTRKAYASDIKNQQENFETRFEDQSEHHQKGIENLKFDNKIQLKELAEKTKKIIADRRKKTIIENKELRKRFREERIEGQTNFNRSLSNIKDSYQRSKDELVRANRVNQFKSDNRLDRTIKETSLNTDTKLNELKDRSRKGIKKVVLDNRNQKESLIKKNKKDLEDFQRLSSKDKLMDRSKFEYKFDEQRRIQVDERSALIEKFGNILGAVRIKDDSDIKNLTSRYDRRIEELNSANEQEERKSEEGFRTEVQTLKADKERAIYGQQRRAQIIDDNRGKGDSAKYEQDRITNNFETKLKKQSKIIGNKESELQSQVKEIKYNLEKTLQEKELDNTKKYNKQLDESSLTNKEFKEHAKKINRTLSEKPQDTITNNENKYVKDLIKEQASGKVKAEGQKKLFQDTINQLVDKNHETETMLKDNFAVENKKNIMNFNKTINNQSEEQKEYFHKKMGLLIESYEGVLDRKNLEISNLERKFSKSINIIERKTNKELHADKILQQETRKADQKASKKSIKSIRDDFAGKFRKLRNENNAELNRTKMENERKFTSMTQDHEDETEKMKFEFNKLLLKKVGESQEEYERFVHTSKFEKENLIKNYETRLKEVRLSFK